MNDTGTDFATAMQQANDESLDDLAHYRPNRHGTVDLDCFGKGYRVLEPSDVPPIEVRKYPEDGCPRQCTQCQTPFLLGITYLTPPVGSR